MQAQDVDRAQTRHPPSPCWGWRSSCCGLGTGDERGPGGARAGGPLENTRVCGGCCTAF